MANLEFRDTHNMVAYLKKPEGSEDFHQIVDFLNTSHIRYALTDYPTIYVSLIQQFWETASTRTLENGEVEITATIDEKVKTVTEASIRRHLKLEDSDGISSLPTIEIFEQLSLMGSLKLSPIRHGGATTTFTSLDAGQGSGNIDKTPYTPHDSPLPRVNTLGSDEDSMTLQELTVLCTQLSKKVESLGADLKQTKNVYGAAYTKLIRKVKRLERAAKYNQDRRRARIVVSDDEEDLEDPSKHGRKIAQIDEDEGITLVQMGAQTQGRYGQDMEFETEVYTPEDVSIAGAAVTTASVTISTASPLRVYTADDISTAETLVYIKRSASKDKGKAVRLQEQLDEKERQRIARVHEEARSFNVEEWEDIQARVEVDEELAQRLQADEREKHSEAKKVRLLVEVINQRKRHFAQQKAEAKRNKPMTQAQQRTYMSNYIKNMGNYTLKQLKSYSFAEIKTLFETTMREMNLFKKVLEAKRLEKLITTEIKETNELSQGRVITMMIIFYEQGMNVVALQTTFDKDDLVMLWSLVKEKFNSTEPTDDKEREIWIELKRLFEPDTKDKLWKLQKHIHDLTWRLYDTYGVHHVSTTDGVDIYMLVEREYRLLRGVLTQMMIAKLLVEQDNEMSRELLRKIFMQAERPRR
ncbi:hypothetical protein Tco_0568802 [Tanacetum coccineum]